MSVLMRRAARNETGTTSIEYALIAMLISTAIIAGASGIAPAFNAVWPTLIAVFT